MLCFTFMIALVLPWSSALEGNRNKNVNLTVCSDPEVLKVGDEFFKCFDVNVKNSIRLENTNCTKPLAATIFDYVRVANQTCYNDTINKERDSLEFYKLIKFSMKNGNYKEFVENGGVECIKAIKEKITECVTGTVGQVKGANNKYHTLWKKTKLTIDVKSCRETNKIKLCTLNAMRSEGYSKCGYNNDNVLYVSSLFDYMLERCTRLKPQWAEIERKPRKMNEQRSKDDVRTTHIMLGLLLTLALLGTLYVLFRDCRLSKSHVKRFSDNFVMSQRRRRSLVNNEAGHEN